VARAGAAPVHGLDKIGGQPRRVGQASIEDGAQNASGGAARDERSHTGPEDHREEHLR
jgi:hypothetical protein